MDLPDGLQRLRVRNLLTYKSRHESLGAWALDEPVGQYVNYRTLTRPDADAARSAGKTQPQLHLQADLRLYALATREPRCSPRRADVRPTAQQGVFDVRGGMRDIRLILLSMIAKHSRNAPWELFSSDLDRIRHAARPYRPRHAGA